MLYVMRHGMTDWNAIHRLQGKTDIPLNDEGIEMAHKAHDEYADVHFDICFYSPLKRAEQTARIVAGDRDIPMICDERLREMSFGICEGTMDYMTNEKSEIFPLFSEPEKYVNPPAEAESIEELCRRTGDFLKEKVIPLLREGKDVLIVGHGAMNSSMIMQIKKLPKKDFWAAGLAKCRLMSFEGSEVINNLQPNEQGDKMEEEKIELYIKELRPDIYLLDEGHSVSGYLVIGEKKACVIDTMNGNNDLGEAVRKLTDKPVFVINTHGHPDHIFGNIYFEEAYINPRDIPLAEMFINDPEFQKDCQKAGRSMPPFKEIKGGDVIDLGGKTLEVYDLPGHTPGGIVLLLKEDRILFAGDSINHHLWMQLDGCPGMEDFVKALDKVMFLEDKADFILHGHARDFDDISLMRCLRQGCAEIAEGKTDNDEIYNWFDGVGRQHKFSLVPGKKYSQEDSVVCYTPAHKKLAVVFPGVGYNQDKPLLYYSSKLVKSKGYDIINISYQNIPSGIMGDATAGKKAAEIAYAQAEEQLSGTDFSKYDDILFIGKSMGTVVAAIYVMNHKIGAKQVWYTPVEATFGFGTKDAVAFIGDADPWSDYNDVKALAAKAGITLHTYPGRNHSLESGFVDTDCRTVKDVISKTSEYITQK